MISKRFTIGRLMLAIAGIAVLLAVLTRYPTQAVMAVFVVTPTGLAWFASYRRPRLAKWCFLASAAWLNASMFVITTYLPVFNNDMIAMLASLVFLPIVPGFGLSWGHSKTGLAGKAQAALWVLALTALPLSMIMTWWPLRLGFYLSSPALNRLADRVDSGGKVDPGELAGIYRIQSSIPVRYDGSTMLIINDDPRGIAGFARKKGAKLGVTRREGFLMGIGISERWGYIAED